MPVLAIAAVAGGAAVATGIVAASTVAMVGLGATVVGKVTKSKELMQLGAGLGLGAGIASVASSVFGTTSAGAGTAAAGSEALANTLPTDYASIDAAAGLNPIADAANASGATAGLEGAASAESAAGSTGGLLGSTPASSAPLSGAPQASMAPGGTQLAGPTMAEAGVGGAIVPPGATDSGSISKWWAKLPESTKNKLLQIGGQAAGGLMEGWTQEQKLALERERMNLLQQKDATAQSNANAQPVVRFKSVSPASGLLSSSRG